ncbi:MAG: aconitase X catalytic domain-containing protein [Chloroflexi bacterium]|nr:aconitase X catalytic domain-containing protein [Chloroflexota bacterium]
MKLTDEEQAMLAGAQGPAVKRAIDIVATLGRVFGADELIPVASVQVAGVSYRNLGDAGLGFLQDWASEGARVRVPTTLNPAGMDPAQWQRQGFSSLSAEKQGQVISAYQAMGIEPICTCTPYLFGNLPSYGEHLAWSESSAVAYANSVLGAHTNREGGPGALAAAICGRTACYGLHKPENRQATHKVDVRCRVSEPYEFAALGYLAGKLVGDGIPLFTGLDLPAITLDDSHTVVVTADESDKCKLLGAALASSGAVALYHIRGVTPEVRQRSDLCPPNIKAITINSLHEALAELNHPVEKIDLVVIGCPHASLAEIEEVARLLRGKHLASALWVTTSRAARATAIAPGWVQDIEAAGGLVIAEGCVVVAPMNELPYRTLATNSAKMASYALPHAGLQVRFGALEECTQAALSGRWGKD